MAKRKILIIKPSSLGDIVHSLPFLHVLRRGLPDAHIAWMVSRANMNLLEGHSEIDELIIFERKRWGGMKLAGCLHELSGFVRAVRSRKFDTVVDLQGLLRSGFFAGLSGASRRVGFANAREFSHLFYNVRVEVPNDDMHAVDRYLLVARELGLNVDDEPTFIVGLSDEDRAFAESLLADKNPDKRPIVTVLPSARWKTKRWPAERFAAAASRIVKELGAVVVLLGAPDDTELTTSICGMMDAGAINLAGKTTLKQSAALMERSAVVVANDSGPMHLAISLGRPVVTMYGPTSDARTGPYGGNVRLLKSDRECAPCFRSRCDNDAECMKDISVDDVFDAVTESLGR